MKITTNNPVVSIIITNYNRENTIGQTIESALLQTYGNLEIIVSDNNSTDNSHEVISKYTTDKRIKYYRNKENIGMINNFKVSIAERATGEYFVMLNSDDTLTNPNFISDAINIISRYENVVILKAGFYFCIKDVAKKFHVFKNNMEFYNGIEYLKNYVFQQDLNWISFLIHRRTLVDEGLLNIDLICSDIFINLNLLLKGNICFYKVPSYQFNFHDSNQNLGKYEFNQIPKIFNEIDNLLNSFVNSNHFNEQELLKLREIYYFHFINDIIKSYYRINRNKQSEIIEVLRNYSSVTVDLVLKSNKFKLFKVIFYFNFVNKNAEYIKWRISNIIFNQ